MDRMLLERLVQDVIPGFPQHLHSATVGVIGNNPVCNCTVMITLNDTRFMVSEEELVTLGNSLSEAIEKTLKELHPEPEKSTEQQCCVCLRTGDSAGMVYLESAERWMCLDGTCEKAYLK